jgi:hypothetical protein
LLVSIGAIFYFASRPNPQSQASDPLVPPTSPTALPTVELTTLPAAVPMTSTEAPITLEQASDFVSSYLACIFDHDDFTIVRVNGVLQIADATTDTAVKC